MFFTETVETNMGHFTFWFLYFLHMKLSLINFFDSTMKQGIHIPLLSTKDGEPKYQIVK